jgi:hypothetical protein
LGNSTSLWVHTWRKRTPSTRIGQGRYKRTISEQHCQTFDEKNTKNSSKADEGAETHKLKIQYECLGNREEFFGTPKLGYSYSAY